MSTSAFDYPLPPGVKEKVWEKTYVDNGKTYHATITQRTGEHMFLPKGDTEPLLVCIVTNVDYGPKLGSGIAYSPVVRASEEERAANRARILAIAAAP